MRNSHYLTSGVADTPGKTALQPNSTGSAGLRPPSKKHLFPAQHISPGGKLPGRQSEIYEFTKLAFQVKIVVTLARKEGTLSKNKFSIRLALISLGFVLSGFFMAVYAQCGLMGYEEAVPLLRGIPFARYIFFYSHFPTWSLPFILSVRMGLGLLQVFGGIYLLRRKAWALTVCRLLMVGFTSLTMINPYYPDYLILASLVLYSLVLLFLYHQNTENLCQNVQPVWAEGQNYPQTERSRLAVLWGCLEFIVGLSLVRFCIWDLPLEGITLHLPTNLDLSMVIVIPKAVFLFLSIMVTTAGILTLSFRPVGRMLSILFCVLGFVYACGYVFLGTRPRDLTTQIATISLIIFTVAITVIVFFLLTNPKVKEQFKIRPSDHPLSRLLSILGFGVFCAGILFTAHSGIRQVPSLFDKSLVQEISKDVVQWEESIYKVKWQKTRRKILNIYKKLR